MWWAAALAWGHGNTLTTLQIAAAPDAPEELWVLTDGWGVLHTSDLGVSWTWHCEEPLGGATPNALAALAGGSVLLAENDGVRRLDAACGVARVEGLPAGAAALEAAGWRGEGWVGVLGGTEGGLYRCDRERCAPTALVGGEGARRYVKRILSDEDGLWVSLLDESTHQYALWFSADGEHFEELAAWSDSEATLVLGAGALVLVWLAPHDGSDPFLVRSADAGGSWETVFSGNLMDDGVPGAVEHRGQLLLGSELGRTWISTDDGRSFTEVSSELPAVRCSATSGGVAWICADHWADGSGTAYSLDGRSWLTGGCLEAATPAECSEDTCTDPYDAWLAAAEGGGGSCYAPPPPPAPGCGGASWLGLGPWAAVGLRRRLRPGLRGERNRAA